MPTKKMIELSREKLVLMSNGPAVRVRTKCGMVNVKRDAFARHFPFPADRISPEIPDRVAGRTVSRTSASMWFFLASYGGTLSWRHGKVPNSIAHRKEGFNIRFNSGCTLEMRRKLLLLRFDTGHQFQSDQTKRENMRRKERGGERKDEVVKQKIHRQENKQLIKGSSAYYNT